MNSRDKSIQIWDPQTGREIRSWLAPGSHDFLALAWSPDGSRLASGAYSQHLYVWETGTWRELLDIPHFSGITAVAWSPDGRYLASGTGGAEAIVWDSRTGQKVNTLRGHLDWVRSIAWIAEGQRLATQSIDGVRIWDPKKTTEASSLEHARANSFAWNAQGSRIATAGGGKVKVWDAEKRGELASWDSAADYCAWHPDGKRLALLHRDSKVEVVDAGTGRVGLTLPSGEQRSGSIPLDWSPDGARLAFADQLGLVTIHDVASGKNSVSLRGDSILVLVVRWSPDGKRLASAGWNGTVHVWETGTWRKLLDIPHFNGIEAVAWSPDGKRLASAGWDQKIEVWDADTGKGLASLRGHTQSVWELDWSPDGKRLASTGGDGTVRLWNADTWEEVLSIEAGGPARHVRWSPNGKQLAVQLTEDGTVKVWDAAAGYEFAQSPAYRLERAEFLARRGRLEEARGLLEKWITEYPGDPAYRARLVAIHWDEGRTQLGVGAPERAVAAFTEVLRLDESAVVYLRRAAAYSSLGEFDKALADCSQALRLDPKHAGAYKDRGDAYFDKSDLTGALADYSQAIRLDPEDPLFYNERGIAYLEKGAMDEGLRDISKAVELAGYNPQFWQSLAAARLAAGRLDEYRRTCAAMVDRFSRRENCWERQATAWACALAPDAIGDWPKVVALAEDAVKARPKPVEFVLALGAVLYRAGRFEEAVQRLTEADRLVPERAERLSSSPAYTWYFLAMAHHRLGHAEEARKWLDKAIAWPDKALREDGTAVGRRLFFYRRVLLERFRAEAAELLGITAKPPAGKEKPEKAK